MKMKRTASALIGAALLALPVLGLAGCDQSAGTFQYDDGISQTGNYDSSVFYRNDLDVDWFADPGVLYNEADGYFYAYGTASDMSGSIRAWKSKNLADWEFVGVVYNCDDDSWAYSSIWAPEVLYYQTKMQQINNEPGLYYMYFSGAWKEAGTGASGYDNLRLSVAVSDSPAGPFVDVGQDTAWTDAAKGDISVAEYYEREDLLQNSMPVIRFEENLTAMAQNGVDLDGRLDGVQGTPNQTFAAIDPSPFVDEDGTLYLYFVQHISTGNQGNIIYGMQMTNPITPNYSTVTPLAACNNTVGTECDYFEKVDGVYKPMDDPSFNLGATEGEINEAPFMQRHVTVKEDGTEVVKYYLTYSILGYSSPQYSVCLALGDSPLGSFKKVPDPSPVHGIGPDFTHMSGCGHHCFVQAGEENFIFYHAHCERSSGNGNPRALAVDRVYWYYNEALGCDIYHSDGPSYSLNPVPEVTSGYANVAPEAEVSVSNLKSGSTAALLTDGMSAIHGYDDALECRVSGSTTITLTFPRTYEVNALFIYNARTLSEAFSKVSTVRMTASDGTVYEVKDLAFNPDYYDVDAGTIRPGAAAVMSFEPLRINKIELVIDSPIVQGVTTLSIDEIKVMGK